MKRKGMTAALLAVAMLAGSAPAAERQDARWLQAEAQREVQAWAHQDFTLPPSLALDPPLRERAEALGAQHRQRLEGLLKAWAGEEAALLGEGDDRRELTLRLLARYLNEVALWQLDSTGADFDRLTLAALRQPGVCAQWVDQRVFAQAVALLQALPAVERERALQAQQALLARWGTRTAAPPPRPAGLFERALREARRPAAERPVLAPVLAWRLLGPSRQPMAEETRCGLRHWWLQQQATATDAAAAELAVAARYDLVGDASQRVRSRDDDDNAPYPPAAARLGIEGKVTVSGRQRAGAPGLDDAVVSARQVTVPGIRGVRPVAFETSLDEGSLRRAAQVAPSDPAPGRQSTVDFVWKLQP